MSFVREYNNKLCSSEEAVLVVEPEDDIIAALAVGEPPALKDALFDHPRLHGNRLFQMLSLRPLKRIEPERLKIISLFLHSDERRAFSHGEIDLLPNHFSDIADILCRVTKKRILMAVAAPMDEHGFFSLGTNCDILSTMICDAKAIVLEVNRHMPRTYGKNQIHISQVAALTENHVRLPETPELLLREKDVQIGKKIAEIINNGDTLQIGFGAIPNAVMNFLTNHRDLGIHTEMIPDKIVDLCQSGAVTNNKKQLFPGKITATFAFGTKRLYDFLHENPDIHMMPASETNDVYFISRFDHMVSINATVEVDFIGQCNSESINGIYHSSTGGQANFARGAQKARFGKGLICLHSTAKNDTITKIVPILTPGAPVTTSKNDVDFIVTEYGAVQLRGKTIRERTLALIGIAHPKFRDELKYQAKKMGYLI